MLELEAALNRGSIAGNLAGVSEVEGYVFQDGAGVYYSGD